MGSGSSRVVAGGTHRRAIVSYASFTKSFGHTSMPEFDGVDHKDLGKRVSSDVILIIVTLSFARGIMMKTKVNGGRTTKPNQTAPRESSFRHYLHCVADVKARAGGMARAWTRKAAQGVETSTFPQLARRS